RDRSSTGTCGGRLSPRPDGSRIERACGGEVIRRGATVPARERRRRIGTGHVGDGWSEGILPASRDRDDRSSGSSQAARATEHEASYHQWTTTTRTPAASSAATAPSLTTWTSAKGRRIRPRLSAPTCPRKPRSVTATPPPEVRLQYGPAATYGQKETDRGIQRSVVLNLQSRPDVTKYVWAAW